MLCTILKRLHPTVFISNVCSLSLYLFWHPYNMCVRRRESILLWSVDAISNVLLRYLTRQTGTTHILKVTGIGLVIIHNLFCSRQRVTDQPCCKTAHYICCTIHSYVFIIYWQMSALFIMLTLPTFCMVCFCIDGPYHLLYVLLI